MDELRYQVSFSGQIQEGADLARVKASIAKMFKADEVTIARLFSGKRIVIKKNLTAEAADKYSIAFTKAGAICDLDVMEAGTAAASPATAKPAPKKSAGKKGGSKIAIVSAAIVGVIAILVAATPYVTGVLAEQKYREGMVIFQDFVVQQSGAFTVTTDVDYQRGWLSSTAINTITLEVPDNDPLIIELNSNISHGPLLQDGPKKFGLASIDTRMPLTAAQRADMAKIWKGNDNPIQVQSHMDYDGQTLTEISIAGFELDQIDDEPDSKLRFETLKTTITLSEQFTRADADMAWNGMQLDTPDAKVVVGKLSGYSNKKMTAEGLWLGDDEFKLAGMSYKVVGDLPAASANMPSSGQVKDLQMTAQSEMDGSNLVRGHTTITVADVIVQNLSVASNIKMTLAVERLQAEALQAITEKVTEYQKNAIQTGNPGQAPGLALIQNELAAILAAGPVVRIPTLEATTTYGKVDADFEATIQVNDPVALQNPMFLLLAMQASGQVELPASLVETTPLVAFVPGFIEQGYIDSDQGQLKTKINFQQGQLTLNGRALQP